MTKDSPIGGTIAPAAPVRKHDWIGGRKWDVLAHESASGCDETHKQCAQCPIIKITVHPPQGVPFRVWQSANGKRWQGDHAPPCVAPNPPQEIPIQ